MNIDWKMVTAFLIGGFLLAIVNAMVLPKVLGMMAGEGFDTDI